MRRIVVLAGVLVLVGCSSPGTDDVSTQPVVSQGTVPVRLPGEVTDNGIVDMTAAGHEPRVEIDADDDSYQPTFVKVSPSATVTVVLRSRGQHRHTFTIEGGPDVTVEPGQVTTVEVTAPAQGHVAFSCRIHGNIGMKGALFVDAATGSDRVVPTTQVMRGAPGEGY